MAMEKRLMIFAADHRSTLKTNIMNIKNSPSRKQLEYLHDFKAMILESMTMAINKGLNKEDCALLMDEDYGEKQLRLAKKNGIKIIVPVEKSGQKTFDFNYGKNFPEHIEKFNPDFVKVLLHFNPKNGAENEKSLKNLRILNNYLSAKEYRFLLEVLIDPTEKQLKEYGKKKFNTGIRPLLTVEAIKQLHNAGIYPSVWKLEGYEKKESYKLISAEIGDGKIIILGRSESMEKVLKWINIGCKNDKVIGFAVGRTIFMNALKKYYAKKISRESAIKIMANRYYKISKFFLKNSNRNDSV